MQIKRLLTGLLLACFQIGFGQSLKRINRRTELDSNYFSPRRVSIDQSGYESTFIGVVRNQSTLKKRQLLAEFGGSVFTPLVVSYGLTQKIELNAGVLAFGISGALFSPYFSAQISHPIGNNIRIGANLQTHHSIKSSNESYFSTVFSHGIQFQNKRLLLSISTFILLGKSQVTDEIMLNSVNFIGLWRIVRNGNIGLIYCNPINPNFYVGPSLWNSNIVYLPPSLTLYYDFMFKRSTLSVGSQVMGRGKIEVQKLNPRFDFFPFLKYNYLIKKH